VLDDIICFTLNEGYDVLDLSYSPITGGDGNIEFLLHLYWDGEEERGRNKLTISPQQIVAEAHEHLKGN